MTSLSLRNPIAVLMLCVGLVVFAGVVTPRMAVDTFPELTPPVLIIGTLAPGLAARDVEKTISWRLEKYVSATPGVDHVESLSRNNFSVIYVWLKWGTDLNAAQTLVQSQAGFAMAAIPKSLGVLPPFVLQYDPSNAPVCQVVVSGAGYTGPQLYDYAFNNIEPLLEGISGVASAAPDGGRQRQINVVVDPVKAQARRVTAPGYRRRRGAVERAPALGRVHRAELRRERLHERHPEARRDHRRRPGEGRRRQAGPHPATSRASRTAARPRPRSSRSTDATPSFSTSCAFPAATRSRSSTRSRRSSRASRDLPPGMQAKVYFDQSIFVRTAYHGLKKEIVQALVLIALVILLFLQSVRGTLIVSVAIPLSFAITLIVLYATGQTLNAFTLGGLTLAMGRLVDDAVVVLESIHRHQRMGMSTAEAALKGTNAVALPVLASTLTTMAVLLPVVLLAGLARKLFAPLAITVAVAMIASYFVSMAVTPVACRFFLGHAEHGRFGKAVEGLIDRIADGYSRGASRRAPVSVHHRDRGLRPRRRPRAGPRRGSPSTFFPEIDEVDGHALRPLRSGHLGRGRREEDDRDGPCPHPGAPRGHGRDGRGERRNAAERPQPPGEPERRTEHRIPAHRLLRSRGAQRSRSRTSRRRARAILTRDFPGVEVLQYPGGLVASVFANGYTAPFVVEVHNDNLAELDEEAKAVADVARTIPGIRDVKESLQIDYPEIHVDTEPRGGRARRNERARRGADDARRDARQHQRLRASGSTRTTASRTTSSPSTTEPQVPDTQALGALPVRVSPQGKPVLLGAYGNIRRDVGAVAVERNHLARVAHVLMQTEGRDIGSARRRPRGGAHADPRTRDVDFASSVRSS